MPNHLGCPTNEVNESKVTGHERCFAAGNSLAKLDSSTSGLFKIEPTGTLEDLALALSSRGVSEFCQATSLSATGSFLANAPALPASSI